MRGWLHWPLRGRTLPVIALIVATILVVAGGAIAFYEDSTYRAQKAEEVRIQGEILSSAVEAALAPLGEIATEAGGVPTVVPV